MRPDEVPDWLRSQQRSARAAARAAHDPREAAALRGKATAYAEAENALRQALAPSEPEGPPREPDPAFVRRVLMWP